MALRANIPSSAIGISISNAYVRVLRFRGDKDKVYVNVGAYASETARHGGAATVTSAEYQIETSSLQGDFLSSVYNWLKLQPEFADAIDC